ncbi:MAG: DNA cytosine methyltransferase [Steroidobacter sp.]
MGLASPKTTFLEFFAGSGLVREGLKGLLTPLWANDNCARKAAIYTANHGDQHFRLDSIEHVAGRDLPAAAVAWASFPCQDLSLAGNAEGIRAARSGLVWEWLRIIDEMPNPPAVLLAENVLGLISSAQGRHYGVLHDALNARGYRVGAMLIDAVRWVPQSRPRVFVLAIRCDVEIPAALHTHGPTWLHPEPVRNVAKRVDDWLWWSMPEPPMRRRRLCDVVEWDAQFPEPQVERRNLGLISARHAAVIAALPTQQPFVAPGYRRTRNAKQVLELRFDDVAGCLRTPEGGSSRQLLVMRRDGALRSRLLTVREAARLMGAPDSYQLPGSYNDAYKAMGDAVAAPVARWLGRHLLRPLAKAAASREHSGG